MTIHTQFLINRDQDLDNLQSPELRKIFEFWSGLRAGDRLPARSDFYPTDLPARLLPHISIAEILRDGGEQRFRWRLVGTHTTEKTGRDVTGRYFDDVYAGDDYDDLVAAYVWVAEHGRPLRWHGNSHFVDKDWMSMEIIGLPLAEDGETVDKILCGMVFQQGR